MTVCKMLGYWSHAQCCLEALSHKGILSIRTRLRSRLLNGRLRSHDSFKTNCLYTKFSRAPTITFDQPAPDCSQPALGTALWDRRTLPPRQLVLIFLILVLFLGDSNHIASLILFVTTSKTNSFELLTRSTINHQKVSVSYGWTPSNQVQFNEQPRGNPRRIYSVQVIFRICDYPVSSDPKPESELFITLFGLLLML